MLCEDLSQQAQQATAEAQRLQAELDLMTISQPNVGEADGDVELFEQLFAAQKEELEVFSELTDSSAETIEQYERQIEDLTAERDSALRVASKATEKGIQERGFNTRVNLGHGCTARAGEDFSTCRERPK